jgi:hypothetical protein
MSNRAEQPSYNPSSNDLATSSDGDLPPIPSIESYPVTTVDIDLLVFDGSPRLAGEDPRHTRVLAEANGALPPITVHRPTMRVIDGTHRVRAAVLNGKSVIDARLLDCDEGTAFVAVPTRSQGGRCPYHCFLSTVVRPGHSGVDRTLGQDRIGD